MRQFDRAHFAERRLWSDPLKRDGFVMHTLGDQVLYERCAHDHLPREQVYSQTTNA